MSLGGVSPFEWILPPLAASHAIVNTAAGFAGSKGVVAPTSPTAKRDAAQEQMQQTLADQQKLSQQRAAQVVKPFTAEQEFQSRQRALSASEFLAGSKKTGQTASQTLGY